MDWRSAGHRDLSFPCPRSRRNSPRSRKLSKARSFPFITRIQLIVIYFVYIFLCSANPWERRTKEKERRKKKESKFRFSFLVFTLFSFLFFSFLFFSFLLFYFILFYFILFYFILRCYAAGIFSSTARSLRPSVSPSSKPPRTLLSLFLSFFSLIL